MLTQEANATSAAARGPHVPVSLRNCLMHNLRAHRIKCDAVCVKAVTPAQGGTVSPRTPSRWCQFLVMTRLSGSSIEYI